MASSPTPRHEPKALVTFIMPKRSLHAEQERAARAERADYILGESGLEDIEDSFARQSLALSAGADAVEIANLDKNKNGGIGPDIRQLPAWEKIDHVGQACILKILSEEHGSFQKACKALLLEPAEAESFLRKQEELIQQLNEFHRNEQEGSKAYGQKPVTYRGPRTTGIFMQSSTIKLASEYLGYLGLNGASQTIQGREGRKITWPLDIDASDFNPLELGTTGPNFPRRASTPPDESSLPSVVSPSLADDCRVFIAFSAADRKRKVLRMRSILLPMGATIVGPAGAKELVFGGRYHIIYPSRGWELQGPDVHEFLICANQAPPPSQGVERAVQHGNDGGQRLRELGQVAEEPTTRQSSVRDMGEERETVPPGTPPVPVFQGAAATHTGSPSDEQGGVLDVDTNSPEPAILMKPPTSAAHAAELRNLWLPDECPLKGARASSAASMVSDNGSQTKSEANTELPLEQGFKIHYYVRGSDRAVSQPEGANVELANWDIEDGLAVPLFDIAESQQQGPQEVEGMPYIPDQATIPGVSALRKSAVNSQPAPFHANENIFGPPRKQEINPLVPIANGCSPRVLLQFRLPERYVIKSPTGFVMNFDDAWNGPGDGNGGGGLGGVYTVVLRDQQAAPGEPASLPPIPELDDRVQLRMNLAERMAVIRDSYLLPRLTEQGLHEMSMVQTTDGNDFDLVCENGPYQVFRDMTSADNWMFLPHGHPNMMSAFEPEGGSIGQSRGSSTTHEARRVTRAGNFGAHTQAGKHEAMDVDGEGEELDGEQGRENKRRKFGHPRGSTTEIGQAKDTAQQQLVTAPAKRGTGKGTEAARKPEKKKSKAPQLTTGRTRKQAQSEVVPAPRGVPKTTTESRSSLAVGSRIDKPATATRSSKRLAASSTAELAIPTPTSQPTSQPSVLEPPKGAFKRPRSSPIQHDGARKRLRPDSDLKPKSQSEAHKTRGRRQESPLGPPANAAEKVQDKVADTVPGRGRGKNIPELIARGIIKPWRRSEGPETNPDEREYADEDEAGGDTTDADATYIEDPYMEDLDSS